MHPSVHAASNPNRAAVIIAETGETTTYGELDRRSNQVAQLLRTLGVQQGDRVALMLDNNILYHEIVWGAQRAGVQFVCISSKLTASEAAYIVDDCGAKVLFTSRTLGDAARALAPLISQVVLFMTNGPIEGYRAYEDARAAQPDMPICDETAGNFLFYSSGTTGQPKGVHRELSGGPITEADGLTMLMRDRYGFNPDTRYLCPAPLYHAAPMAWTLAVHRLGGTVVIMEKFDAEQALAAIEAYRITHAQFVPTHFIRMLKLPKANRLAHSRPNLEFIIHAAAPCPIPVKEAMIDWWGPIIWEYYAGTEGNGMTLIAAADWLAHKGSVGRPVVGELHICDEGGDEVPPRTEGTIYFGGGEKIVYRNDPIKTAEAYNKHGWSTIGDVGWVDEDGYLYLTDRKSFMIISGGVNIYPQEVENLLITHPKVMDVAVIGGPDPDFGERVIAVVQPMEWADAGDALREELLAFARGSLSGVKIPRRIDFRPELPRHATGKLYKRLLRDEYWQQAAAANGDRDWSSDQRQLRVPRLGRFPV